ncbi:MAG TPA: DUF456 domain-containing protein [Syntrophomonadaceae bacterium]|jgi:uncharacterized protein YqgC (DUF456 family)|nr:DUF456 domain-containing protein [Syntrophomonadaceae bacterium]HRX21073.1 DUF456 domain-containing protein [Syntrophomonadaceae bacterium]
MLSLPTIVLVAAILLCVIGVLGTILPMLPGVAMIFIVIAAYGWWEGFHTITFSYLLVLGLLTLLSAVLNYLSSVMGAKFFGSTKAGLVGALLGTFIGIFFFPPIGIIIGPLAGAFIGEYISKQDVNSSLKAGLGAVIGMFTGVVFQFVMAAGFLVSFLIKVL